ncbi:hypothetical protein EC973_007766 [Apophysomyces ossiformis]|uniref:Metallo-beta-lactamase domain-containing protein n=1 Tax=Apophysomyces ossiformis TaxID=679940 RepID=A0A8H7BZC0_9FUNG|nr:hypothetical protein EC973_007766 [Apophysomyces ossiformis]
MTVFQPAAPNDKSYKLTNRANDLFERHLYQDAITEYTKAIQASRDGTREYLALLHSNRSANYILTNQFEAAQDDARRTMELAPFWAKGYYRYAEALVKLGQYDEAIKYYKYAAEKEPSKADFIVSRVAKALVDKDNEDMGLTILQLIPGRDIAIDRNFRNPIQNRIYELAQIMRNIIYVVADEQTKQCVSWDTTSILRILDERGYTIVATVVTHYHFDHVGGSPPPPYDTIPIKIPGLSTLLKKLPHIKAYVHPQDIPFILQNTSIPANRLVPTCTDVTETLEIGKTKIRFLHTPGHTPGSQSLLINNARLLSGDTLLCGFCGRTDLQGGDRKAMERTLRQVMGRLDDRIVVYPGHHYGSDWSTIGIERDKGCLGDDLVGFGMSATMDTSSLLHRPMADGYSG